ncbi:tetratricopeptide repeat protein [Poriferisphaera sp. WC338]|uniref:tetratricopeptide repeat protein n=1 Tax=Poriferisphaera sp. WC338 TaxID=3425129 RepID=UPI003D81AD21
MDNKMKFRVIAAIAMFSVVVLIGGCQAGNNNTHKQWMNEAKDRYLSLRSGMKLQMAVQQFETGDFEQCERTLNEAMGMDPKNDSLALLAGRLSLEKGRLERALHWFNRAIELEEKNADAFYYRGVVQQRWKRYEQALESYHGAYELEKDNPSYLLAEAEILVALDFVDAAISKVEDKLDYFDHIAGLRVALAHMYRVKGDHEKAAHYFGQASMLEPENLKLREEQAISQVSAKDFQTAVVSLKALLENPEYVTRNDLRRLLAEAYEGASQVKDARRIYADLTGTRDSQVDDWIRYGELSWAMKDWSGALRAANRVMSTAPDRHEGYLLAGMISQKRGRLDQAIKYFDRSAELALGDAVPCILRGLSLQKAGRKSAAVEAYREALRREPEDLRARKLLQSLVPDQMSY